jgi:hypothetical protein
MNSFVQSSNWHLKWVARFFLFFCDDFFLGLSSTSDSILNGGDVSLSLPDVVFCRRKIVRNKLVYGRKKNL